METTEEILNKLLERIKWCKKEAVACDEEAIFWAKRGRFTLRDAWKSNAEGYRKVLEEIEKRIESAIKEEEDD